MPSHTRQGTLSELELCKGTCGRMVHQMNVIIEGAPPDTVRKYKGGMCETCWTTSELARPLDEKEVEAIDHLERFMAKRRERIAEQKRLESYRKNRVNVNINEPLKLPTIHVVEAEKLTAKRSDMPRREPKPSDYRVTYPFPEGVAEFYCDIETSRWYGDMFDAKGELVKHFPYGYSGVKHVRARAKQEARSLGWTVK